MKAKLSNARISPKKMNLVAGLIRRQNVEKALQVLAFTNKKAAQMLEKLVASAVANAENNFKQNRNDLIIEEVKVTKGSTLKRFRPVSRGRAHPIKKINSHVIVILKAEAKEEVAAKPKAEKKAA